MTTESNPSPANSIPNVNIKHRDVFNEPRPRDGGVEVFDTPAAMLINKTRMDHLMSLGLEIAGARVLDVGCGVGHLAQRFVEQRCRVLCIDGRKENLESLHQRYPHTPAKLVDVETESFISLGHFDIVFAYGLLYHVCNPMHVLSRMVEVCDDLLFLETIICDSKDPIVLFEDETRSANQAVAVLGCRPSPSFITMALDRLGMPYVYAPRVVPAYEDFTFPWRNDLSWRFDGHNIRCTFVASRRPLDNPNLVNLVRNSPAIAPAHAARSDQANARALVQQSWEKAAHSIEALAWLRPLTPYPGWFFSADYESKEPITRLRRQVWDQFGGTHGQLAQQPIVMPWYYGTRLEIYLGNDLSLPLYVGGCYDPNELAFLNHMLKAGDVVMDVGANEGVYTLFFAGKVGKNGRVIAMEPSGREYTRLTRNIAINDVHHVIAQRLGLYDRNDHASMHVAMDKHAGQNTLGNFIYEGVKAHGNEKIQLVRLDDWVARENITQLDFIKLDMEGAEFAALSGAMETLRKFRPKLLLEIAPDALRKQGASVEALTELLQKASYKLYVFDSATGWPVAYNSGPLDGNIVALPDEMPLPANPFFQS